MIRITRWPVWFALWAGALSCADQEDSLRQLTGLLQRFEPPYKLSLYHTSQNDLAAAAETVDQAVAHWDSIYTRFAAQPPAPFRDDPHWNQGVTTVRRHLVRSRDLIRNGQALQAHETLEQVRFVLADLRERNGVVALMDRLTRFHEPMERMVLLAKGKTPEQLSDAVLDSMIAVLPDLEASWEEVASFPAEAIVHGRPSGFRWQVDRESETIAALRQALMRKDRQAIVQLAPQLEQVFAAIFLNFG